MKLRVFSCDAIRDSTSLRKCLSPAQACERNTPRSSGRYLVAELNISLICCQRSGVISWPGPSMWFTQVKAKGQNEIFLYKKRGHGARSQSSSILLELAA